MISNLSANENGDNLSGSFHDQIPPLNTDNLATRISGIARTNVKQAITRNKGTKKLTIASQLVAVRDEYHAEFESGMSSKRIILNLPNTMSQECNDTQQCNLYPPGTTILIGDSMINQLTSKGLSGKDRNVIVIPRNGARITDVKFQLMKIVPNKPPHVIFHVGTNNATSDTSRQICDDLLFLKFLINEKLPECIVSISCPIMRLDNGKANITIKRLNNHLKELNINVIDHSNINEVHLARKGLHLNDRGIRQLASNIIVHLQRV